MQFEDETHSSVASAPGDLDSPRLLAIWDGGTCSVPLPLRGTLSVGRSARCGLRIDHASVSREHALVHAGTPPSIEDLGSWNGTLVAGQKLTQGQRLALPSDSAVQVGEALLVLQTRAAKPAREKAEGDAMAEVHRLADLVATGDLSVILRGETGAGKEVLAQRIHARSPRAKGPFLAINCAAFSEPMVESELFGHERGAFTGALQAKPGLLEAAHGGTVLLDELGELSLAMQAKLLRALGNREVLRVGAVKPRPIYVRFLCATHRDLEAMVERGSFRSDLYFRLNGISLHVPPLRERPSDIARLSETFARESAKRLGLPFGGFGAAAHAALLAHAWPGNVRELKSVVDRALLLSRGAVILPAHLDLAVRDEKPSAAPLRSDLARLEMERIQAALDASGGNQTKAAKTLGLSRRALLHRLDAYGFPRPRKSVSETEHD